MTETALKHVYVPHGSAKELFHYRGPEVVLSGPAGTGKSRACLEKLHFMALLNPGMRALIIRKTKASLGATALKTWTEHVAPEAIANGDLEYFGGNDQKPAGYYYTNGSQV